MGLAESRGRGGTGCAVEAAVLADGAGSGAGGAWYSGRVAHQMPASTNSATPTAGSHIGVGGSSKAASCLSWASIPTRIDYQEALPVKSPPRPRRVMLGP